MADPKKNNMLGSLIGMPLSIGSMIPQLLKKNSQGDQLRKMQAGQGAGAEAVRAVTTKTARDMANIAGSGRSGSRGLALTAALRAGGEARGRGAAQAAQVAAGESAQATAALRADDQARKGMIGQVGQALSGGLAQMQAQKMATADATAAQTEKEADHARKMEELRLILGDPEAPATEAVAETVPGAVAEAAPEEAPLTEIPFDPNGPDLDDLEAQDATAAATRDALLGEVDNTLNPALDSALEGLGAENVPYLDPSMDPFQAEQVSIQNAKDKTLGSSEALLLLGSGLTPDEIITQLNPGLIDREAQLATLKFEQGQS